MRTREVVTHWNTMQEGDVFLRYEQQGAVKVLVVQREAPVLPSRKGAMGYATLERSGAVYKDTLIIRMEGPGGTHPNPWIAPLVTTRPLFNDSHIATFHEVRTAALVDPDDLRRAMVAGSGKDQRDLDFMGVRVNDMVQEAMYLFYEGE